MHVLLYACTLAATLQFAPSGYSQCVINPIYRDAARLPPAGSPPGAYESAALAWLDNGCAKEARQALTLARAQLPQVDPKIRGREATGIENLTNVADAVLQWQRGDVKGAATLLEQASDDGVADVYRSSATVIFAELLMQNPDDALWAKLRPRLTFYRDRGFWRAEMYLALYGLTPENIDLRIRALRNSMSGDGIPLQSLATREVILMELLRRAGRLKEAELLSRDQEDFIGKTVLQNPLRAYYLTVCANIADNEVRAGEQAARSRLAIYQQALREFYAY